MVVVQFLILFLNGVSFAASTVTTVVSAQNNVSTAAFAISQAEKNVSNQCKSNQKTPSCISAKSKLTLAKNNYSKASKELEKAKKAVAQNAQSNASTGNTSNQGTPIPAQNLLAPPKELADPTQTQSASKPQTSGTPVTVNALQTDSIFIKNQGMEAKGKLYKEKCSGIIAQESEECENLAREIASGTAEQAGQGLIPVEVQKRTAVPEGQSAEAAVEEELPTGNDRASKIEAANNKHAEKVAKGKAKDGDAAHRRSIAKAGYGATNADVSGATVESDWQKATKDPSSPCAVGKTIDGKYGNCKTTSITSKAGMATNMVAEQGGTLAIGLHGQKGQTAVQQNGGGQADAYDNVASTADFASKVQGLKGIMNLGVAAFQWSNFFKHKKNEKELADNTNKGEDHLVDGNGGAQATIEEKDINSENTEFKAAEGNKVVGKIIENYGVDQNFEISQVCSTKAAGPERNQCLKKRAEQYLGKSKGMGNQIIEIGAAASAEQKKAKEEALGSAMYHSMTGAQDAIGAYTYKKHADNMREAAQTLREIEDKVPDDIYGQDPVAPPESDYTENTGRTGETITPTTVGLSNNDATAEDESALTPPPPAGEVVGGIPDPGAIPFLPGTAMDSGGGPSGGGGGGFGFGGTQSTGEAKGDGEGATDPSFADNRTKNSSYSSGSTGGKRNSGGGGAGNKKAKAEDNPFAQMLAQLLGKTEEKTGPENGILSFQGRDLASTEEEGSLLGQNVDLFDRVSKAYISKTREGSFAKRKE